MKFHVEIPQDIMRTNVLTKFNEEINSTTPGGHVFQHTGTIFELIQDIIKTNVLTKCYEDWTINVTIRVLTTSHPRGHVFKPIDRTINVASRVLTRKNAPPHCGHVFQATIKKNLTKFHNDRTINLASRVLTRKNAPPSVGNVFQPNPFSNSSKISLRQTINVASRVLTRFHFSHIYIAILGKIPCRLLQTKTIFELIPDVIRTYVLTKFHQDRNINLAFMVLTRKNAPPNGGHVFQPTGCIFDLVQDIIETNLLTKFHEERNTNRVSRVITRKHSPHPGGNLNYDRIINVASIKKCLAPWRPYIIGTNLLTNFLEDRTNNVASRVLTRKNAKPPGDHDFQATVTIFELAQDIKTNLVYTKLHRGNFIIFKFF
ncbi:hypothetical protein DPMN_168341 [Dreissena polymorpha]|uniref:Uncharacterized protein n=1 Tax=Dreissena polymorpha TaxID=45954 RepID=A0A9D4IVU4_DREPO|nr:hypothetical protein DPMN_168341 [Dreissena polymorpha]